jgi:hypothetical protein
MKAPGCSRRALEGLNDISMNVLNDRTVRTLNQALSDFAGRRIARVHRSMASIISLDIESRSPSQETDVIWPVHSHWMIFESRRIVCTTESKAHLIDRALSRLVDGTIEQASFCAIGLSLLLTMKDSSAKDTALVAVPALERGFEHWHIKQGPVWWTFGPGLRLTVDESGEQGT